MMMKIFVAGASGVVGWQLCRLLVADGYKVTGSTRSVEKVEALSALGVNPVLVDVFDEARLKSVVIEAQPDIVIHQLTDLPDNLEPSKRAYK